MLCYYGRFKAPDYNKDKVINTFIDWMQTTKNRMEGFSYDGTSSFLYQLSDKQFKLNDFTKQSILGIQFNRVENRKNNHFTVEVLYDYKNNELSLIFYKEIKDNSTLISSISLPKVFEMYMRDLKDGRLLIADTPLFTDLNRLKHIHQYSLPLVVLYRKGRCKRNPMVLAKSLYGIAHIVVCKIEDESLLDTMRVYYPDGSKEDYNIYDHIIDDLRNYLVEENAQEYTYQELETLAYEDRYLSDKKEHDDLVDSFNLDINERKDLIDMLVEDNKTIEVKIQQLEEENKKMRELLDLNNRKGLIYLPEENNEVREYIYDKVKQAIQSLDVDNANKIFRRKDILESIMEAKDEN